MEIFIAWAGSTSRKIASALHQWIPMILQAASPWMSEYDVEKGRRWEKELSERLAQSDFGLVCLTPDNLNSTWIHFESGALAKSVERARLWTFLYSLSPSDVPQPLGGFQHTIYKRADVRKLVQSVNSQLEVPLSDARLSDTFEIMWPKFEEMMSGVEIDPDSAFDQRSEKEILDEILDAVRGLSRDSDRFSSQPTSLTIDRDPILMEVIRLIEYVKSLQVRLKRNKHLLDRDSIRILYDHQNFLRDVYQLVKRGLLPQDREKLGGELHTVDRNTDDLRAILEKREKKDSNDTV